MYLAVSITVVLSLSFLSLSCVSLKKHFPISSLCIQFCTFIPLSPAHSPLLLFLSCFFFLTSITGFHPPASSSWRIRRSRNLPCLMLSKAFNNIEIALVPSHHRWRHRFSSDLIWHHDNLPLGNRQSESSCEMQWLYDTCCIILIDSAGPDQCTTSFLWGKWYDHTSFDTNTHTLMSLMKTKWMRGLELDATE